MVILASSQSDKKVSKKVTGASQRKNHDVVDMEESIWNRIVTSSHKHILVVVSRVIRPWIILVVKTLDIDSPLRMYLDYLLLEAPTNIDLTCNKKRKNFFRRKLKLFDVII